jgi:hypothetical protein
MGIQSKPLHAVMVVTCAPVKVHVAAIVPERCHILGQRIAERVNHLHLVALGHHHSICQTFAYSMKAQAADGIFQTSGCTCRYATRCAPTHTQAAQQCAACCTNSTDHHTAPVQPGLNHSVNVRIAGAIGVFAVENIISTTQKSWVHRTDLMETLKRWPVFHATVKLI